MANSIAEKQVQNLIRRTVIDSLQGVLTDPDYGLEIREEVAERLKRYSKRIPKSPSSLDKVRRKYL